MSDGHRDSVSLSPLPAGPQLQESLEVGSGPECHWGPRVWTPLSPRPPPTNGSLVPGFPVTGRCLRLSVPICSRSASPAEATAMAPPPRPPTPSPRPAAAGGMLRAANGVARLLPENGAACRDALQVFVSPGPAHPAPTSSLPLSPLLPARPGRLHTAGQRQSPQAGVWVGCRKAESGSAKGADGIHTGLRPSYRASDHRRDSTLLPQQTQSQRDCHKSFLKQKANAGNTDLKGRVQNARFYLRSQQVGGEAGKIKHLLHHPTDRWWCKAAAAGFC